MESITSGQSGDCLVYSLGFIYMWVCAQTMVCALHITDHYMVSSINCPMGIIPQKLLKQSILSSQSNCTNHMSHSHVRGSHQVCAWEYSGIPEPMGSSVLPPQWKEDLFHVFRVLVRSAYSFAVR